MKKFFQEFQAFAIRGNVMDLAVGVIIGAAFQSVVKSLTDNILSPIIGVFAGANFDDLEVEFLGVVLKYGAFFASLINFIIMAFVVFIIVKTLNKITQPLEEPKKEAATKKCPYCFSLINKKASRCPACTSKLSG